MQTRIMPIPFGLLIAALSLSTLFTSCANAAERDAANTLDARIGTHFGRPVVFLDGRPTALPTVNPSNLERAGFERTAGAYAKNRPSAYFIAVSRAKAQPGWWSTPFWVGDEVSSERLAEPYYSVDEQARFILGLDADACLIVRFGIHEPASWQVAHAGELVVTEDGQRLPVPSLASRRYNERTAQYARAVIEYCERQPWSDRIVGYANFTRLEGTHEPLIDHWLFDHSDLMRTRWREFLQQRYGTVDALRRAWSNYRGDFESADVPRDRLRLPLPQVAQMLYWQPARENQPLRDYLELQRDLYAEHFRMVTEAMADALGDRHRFLVYDTLKQTMLGWSNSGFFTANRSWPILFADDRAGSGGINAARLMNLRGFDGLITPHDYQARGVGGVYEPEGIVDSAVLRGHYFFAEMDTRTFHEPGQRFYGVTRDLREFEAVTWRNIATSLARGFNSYWFDLYTDWFSREEFQPAIARQIEVIRESVHWPHETVPGIAMILDDTAVLETSGSGHYFNEAILWEQKMGMARAGVPYRIYLFEDLALDNFPAHKLFYFPNLFRVDDERLARLKEKVFRDGNVVLWGPGSGISDGKTLGAGHATRLAGFEFESLQPINHPRRVQVQDYDHPITRHLSEGDILGGPLAYGPVLLPRDGHSLGLAWMHRGMMASGLAVKSFGRGAAGTHGGGEPLGEGDWASVFTTAVPIPAALWRGLAEFSGTHVYTDTYDHVMASRSIVALHSIRSGRKRIRLPERSRVHDLVSGELVGEALDVIEFELTAPETRLFRLDGLAGQEEKAAADLPGRKQLFADEAWYKATKEKEQTFEGTLRKAPTPSATSGRWNPVRLVIDEQDTREVYLGGKTDVLDAYVGHKVRIVGKPVEVMQRNEIWPASIE